MRTISCHNYFNPHSSECNYLNPSIIYRNPSNQTWQLGQPHLHNWYYYLSSIEPSQIVHTSRTEHYGSTSTHRENATTRILDDAHKSYSNTHVDNRQRHTDVAFQWDPFPFCWGMVLNVFVYFIDCLIGFWRLLCVAKSTPPWNYFWQQYIRDQG